MTRVFMPQTEKSLMGKKLVGVHIDKKNAHRLAMLSLEKGTPRTAILLELINDYLDKQPSLSEMIENASNKAKQAFLDTPGSKNLTVFCKETEQDLLSHRIDKEIIEEIIKGVKDGI